MKKLTFIKKAAIKKLILLGIAVLITSVYTSSFAQDTEETPDYPVRNPFETGTLIDNQTPLTPYKGMIEFQIYHRFGTVKNGISDLYGIYAPSNIRLGLNYGVTDKIMVGIGTTKDYKLQDIQWKYNFLQQTRSGKVPVFLTYYGNMVIDARADENFGPTDNYLFIHRISYFSQLILARKFNDIFTFQIAPECVYYNAVDPGMKNFNAGLSLGGRAKVLPSTSIIVEYDQPFTSTDVNNPKPNLGFGVEIGTGTHAFQIFMANYSQIINQRNLVYNTNDFTDGDLALGFNITVRF
ncbi:MAG TPA: DUF5777 family beta-barrel protein [Bacteroidales bacterium]|nr:DUF5777 family beta-barrel protein [Bacteroidales bacterium]